jgi:hypothetical protein
VPGDSEKAGGAVLRNLFDDDNAGWLTDPALANQLAADKLETAAAAVRGSLAQRTFVEGPDSARFSP